MQLDLAATERAIKARIADPLGLSVADAAWGIHQVVNESMANAARVHAIERGKDARSFPVFAFGGAGPVHAYRVAEILHAPAMISPYAAGVTSTVGFLTAPLAFDFVRTSYGRLDELDWAAVTRIYTEMEGSGREILLGSGVPESQISYVRSADVRYVGQGYEVRVPLPAGELDAGSRASLVEAFERVYKQLYGRIGPNVGLEVMSWRLVVSGPKPTLRLKAAGPETGTAEGALKGKRPG